MQTNIGFVVHCCFMVSFMITWLKDKRDGVITITDKVESQKKFLSIFENSEEGLAIVNKNQIKDVNKNFINYLKNKLVKY